MKKVDITFNIDPYFFGSTSKQETEAFAFNLNKNIQKIFMVDSDYDLIESGNTYQVSSSDPRLELEISEYIENNWFSRKRK
jgi:uncharacterized protein (DUF1015 family)